VIDVGPAVRSGEIHLYEKRKENEAGLYVALSHCWGSPQVHEPPLKTLQSNLKQMKQQIPWETLSKTFQDAVLITRALGIRFIWIDSLCIVQDDSRDWEEQAADMAAVYRNAYLTISATRASAGGEGCFSQRTPSVKLPSGVFVRKLSHDIWSSISLTSGSASLYPTFFRGWCMQERFLSRRILHYSHDEIVWECMETSACECGVMGGLTQHGDVFKMIADAMDWNAVIAWFSGTRLTKPSDSLPALSGMAAKLASTNSFGHYFAGLWEKDLFYSLTWHCQEPHARPDVFIAPSFSWASVEGEVKPGFMKPGFFDNLKHFLTTRRFGPIMLLWSTRNAHPKGIISMGQ
jgi:hypothetical protein